MSNFCPNCGASLDADAQFCPECGTPVVQQQPASSTGLTDTPAFNSTLIAPKQMDKNTKIGMGAAIAAGLIVFIIIFSVFFGSTYKSPIKDFCKAIEKDKYSTLTDAFYLDSGKNYSAFEAPSKSEFSEFTSFLEKYFGKGYDVDYDIVSKKAVPEKDLKSASEALSKLTKKDVKIKKAYEVKMKLKIKGKKKTESDTQSVVVYKVGTKWYINTTL